MKSVQRDHPVTAGQPVTYETSGHPPRADSPEYRKTRAALVKIAASVQGWYFARGDEPYQDHHGGGLWVHDAKGWFFVRNLVGIEWSGQYCADPAKVDLLRQNAARLYAGFPKSFAAFKELGIDLKALLAKKIRTTEDVANWTDSICNASVPLPQRYHTGAVPNGGGVHNYPTPVTDIEHFKRDNFNLWVLDDEGHPVAVAPVHPMGSKNKAVRVLHAQPGTRLGRQHRAADQKKEWLVLDASHRLAKQAFRTPPKQGRGR